jgi:hypothetical protein
MSGPQVCLQSGAAKSRIKTDLQLLQSMKKFNDKSVRKHYLTNNANVNALVKGKLLCFFEATQRNELRVFAVKLYESLDAATTTTAAPQSPAVSMPASPTNIAGDLDDFPCDWDFLASLSSEDVEQGEPILGKRKRQDSEDIGGSGVNPS